MSIGLVFTPVNVPCSMAEFSSSSSRVAFSLESDDVRYGRIWKQPVSRRLTSCALRLVSPIEWATFSIVKRSVWKW